MFLLKSCIAFFIASVLWSGTAEPDRETYDVGVEAVTECAEDLWILTGVAVSLEGVSFFPPRLRR